MSPCSSSGPRLCNNVVAATGPFSSITTAGASTKAVRGAEHLFHSQLSRVLHWLFRLAGLATTVVVDGAALLGGVPVLLHVVLILGLRAALLWMRR